MFKDPIVEEIRNIRENLAARFDFDIARIVKDAQKRQAESPGKVVTFEEPAKPQNPIKSGFMPPDGHPLAQSPIQSR